MGSDRMLKIQAVQHLDSGTYSCVARNSAGEDTIEIVLEVLGMSVVHKMFENVAGTMMNIRQYAKNSLHTKTF